MLLGSKSSSVGRIDPRGSPDTSGMEKAQIQIGGKMVNLTSDRSARHSDSNGANDTPIQVRMKEI